MCFVEGRLLPRTDSTHLPLDIPGVPAGVCPLFIEETIGIVDKAMNADIDESPPTNRWTATTSERE